MGRSTDGVKKCTCGEVWFCRAAAIFIIDEYDDYFHKNSVISLVCKMSKNPFQIFLQPYMMSSFVQPIVQNPHKKKSTKSSY